MFDLAVGHLGGHLRRIGDGEIGERDTWIRWQYPRLGQSPQLAAVVPDDGYAGRATIDQYEVVDGAGPIELVDPGYADAAISSYAAFAEVKAAGRIPAHVRFMVGLPTPLSVVTLYIAEGSRDAVHDAYSAVLRANLQRILDTIPHDQLAIQWEMCIEFGSLEGIWTHLDTGLSGDDAKPGIAACITELGNLIPQPVELGFHLCYGDAGHQHFVEPTDTGFLAWAATTLLEGVDRPVQWIHLPVPRDRDDVAYYEPIGQVAVPDGTELYLGLVHQTGGLEGTRRRVAAASEVVERFGVATECGLGRRSIDDIPALLDQHAAVSDQVS
jgi:hypothetical protein